MFDVDTAIHESNQKFGMLTKWNAVNKISAQCGLLSFGCSQNVNAYTNHAGSAYPSATWTIFAIIMPFGYETSIPIITHNSTLCCNQNRFDAIFTVEF